MLDLFEYDLGVIRFPKNDVTGCRMPQKSPQICGRYVATDTATLELDGGEVRRRCS